MIFDGMDWNSIPRDIRAFKIENFDKFILTFDDPFDQDGIYMSGYNHKKVFVELHYLHEDNHFSIDEYYDKMMEIYMDALIKQALDDKLIVIIYTDEKRYIGVTEYGKECLANLPDDKKDKLDFIQYIIDKNMLLPDEENIREIIEDSEDA